MEPIVGATWLHVYSRAAKRDALDAAVKFPPSPESQSTCGGNFPRSQIDDDVLLIQAYSYRRTHTGVQLYAALTC
jgi:hypothetical protein